MSFRLMRRTKLLVVAFVFIIIVIVLYKYHNQSVASSIYKEYRFVRGSKVVPSSVIESVPFDKETLQQSSARHQDVQPNVIIEGGNSKYDPKIADLLQMNKCPACLGTNWCKEINSSTTTKIVQINDKTLVKSQHNSNGKFTLITPNNDRWKALDEFICRSAHLTPDCDSALAVANSVIAKANVIDINNYRKLLIDIFTDDASRALRNSNPNLHLHVAFSQCATKQFIYNLRKVFDEDHNKYIDLMEQTHLLTSILAFPTFSTHKFLQRIVADLQIVKIKGSCGRVLSYEGDFQTLKEFAASKTDFETIAGVAMQVIQLVTDLQEEDPNWYFLHTNLTFDSISVTQEGEVILSDLDNIIVVDKNLLDPKTRKAPSLLNQQVCNDPCIEKFSQRFMSSGLSSNNTSSPVPICSQVPHYFGQHMYSMICKNIFSPQEAANNQNPQIIGLLSSVPTKDKENVDDLIRECIYETSPGGRKQAIDELKDILKNYLHFEEADGDDIEKDKEEDNVNGNNYDDEDSKVN